MKNSSSQLKSTSLSSFDKFAQSILSSVAGWTCGIAGERLGGVKAKKAGDGAVKLGAGDAPGFVDKLKGGGGGVP